MRKGDEQFRAMVREAVKIVGLRRLAFESGVSPRAIQEWTSGRRSPIRSTRESVSRGVRGMVERYPDQPWDACRSAVGARRHG